MEVEFLKNENKVTGWLAVKLFGRCGIVWSLFHLMWAGSPQKVSK